MTRTNRIHTAAAFGGLLAFSLVAGVAQAQSDRNILPLPPQTVSTIPSNGDVNPYGVAFVPAITTDGVIQPNDILVSNFNNSLNLQGTGTTIVRVTAAGAVSQFFQGPQKGLTAALGVLQDGIVIVGSLPTADGTSNTVAPGALVFIDRHGHQLGVLTNPAIDGPWGMAVSDFDNGLAQIFISNVLAGTVVRLDVQYSRDGENLVVLAITTIASGMTHRTDPAALVLGPSGLYYNRNEDTLFVASSTDNAVYTLSSAGAATGSLGSGALLFQDMVHLHGPLDITLAPNGHLLIANSDGSNADPIQPSEITEFTRNGNFVTEYPVDPNNGGAFGLNTLAIAQNVLRVAAVDDNANSLSMWTLVLF